MKSISLAIFFCTALFITACSNKADGPVVQIQPGSFVITEPSAVASEQEKSKKCSVDTVNGKERVQGNWDARKAATLTFNGWAFTLNQTVPPEVYIQLTGPVQTYYAVTTSRHMRNDANQAHQLDPSLAVGFELNADANAIEPGIYEVAVLQPTGDSAEFCNSGATLTIN